MGNTPYGYTNIFKPCLKILRLVDPENHRFQCSNGLYNDFDDLGVVREPPHSHPHAWTASCALPLTSSGWQPQTSAAAIKNSLSSAVISWFKQIMKHNCHLRIILSNHLQSRLNMAQYPPVLKHGRLENPRTKRRFLFNHRTKWDIFYWQCLITRW